MMMNQHSILAVLLLLVVLEPSTTSAFTVGNPRAAAFTPTSVMTTTTTTSRSMQAQHHPRNLLLNMVSTEMDNKNGIVVEEEQKQSDETEMEQTTTAMMEASTTTKAPSTAITPIAEEEELSETKKLLQQVKDAGTAGIVSYALWELGFWALSVPVCVFGYYELTGHWPDLANADDTAKLGAEAFAFVNFARFAVPLRIGLALGTTPWIQANVLDRFFSQQDDVEETMEVSMKSNADATDDNKYL